MIPFAMIVSQVLCDRAPEMPLAEWDDTMQTLVLDRPLDRSAYALQFGARTGVCTDAHADCPHTFQHGPTPLPIAIAHQHRAGRQDPIDLIRKVPRRLEHEPFI